MFQRISVAEAKQLLDQADTLLFDVRDEASFQRKHIEGAKHLTKENFNDFCLSIEKETPIIVYCYKGSSSQMLAQLLVSQGFTKVYSMDGGFEAWQNHTPIKA